MDQTQPANSAPAASPQMVAGVTPAPKGSSRGVLGLPSGSIRAILMLLTVGFITIQTARGVKVSLLWFESLMIVLAHYFAYRRMVHMTPDLRGRLMSEGLLEAEPNPLYLPSYSLRLIIVFAFVGLAAYLYRSSRLLDPVALPILISVGSYFLGIAFHAAHAWWNRGRSNARHTTRFDDVRAIFTVVAVALVIVLQLTGLQDYIPHADKFEALPLALMLFYFGSR